MKSILKMVVIGAAPLVICSAQAVGDSPPATQAATAQATQPRLVAQQSNAPLVIPDGTSREHPGAGPILHDAQGRVIAGTLNDDDEDIQLPNVFGERR